MQRDPAGVAAHHLHQHHALMRLRGAVQTIDGIGRDGQRGVEPERHVGAIDVVVDGLGHPDHRDAFIGQPGRRGQRALAADGDQYVDAVVVQCLPDLVEAGTQLVRMCAGSTQHGAALREQPIVPVVGGEMDPPVLEQSPPAVEESDHRRPVPDLAGPDHGPDHRVQSRAVTATG